MQFDVSLIQRVGKDIEESGKRLQEYVNAPDELQSEVQKIQANLNSLLSLAKQTDSAGANARTYPANS
ncbi:hypothetical protein [Brevibacillus fulvus]|uniref:Uncharacterized protein n=1 Tax=Brevibacillus fulvus TaxID=1125967 RepID=A0A939BTJ3_9BACL|nr:hypothetical protein [Brevibacillus fulvus]MBM7588511.1 hypothetical protein [Brevibacillus fulvus]